MPQYYSNQTAIGPRAAVAIVLDLPIEDVELGHDGTGFFILRPEGANPDPEAVAAQSPPPPEEAAPVTDVEIMAKLFSDARAAAPAYLNQLKGTVWSALVAGGMAQDEATAAGVALVLRHAALLAAFESAGGHPVAAQALYTSIASEESVAALPWLTAPILAIFQAALVPN